MEQLSFLDHVNSKGYRIDSNMYEIYTDIMGTFTNYEFTYKYISGSAEEDIESATGPSMHLIIKPIILPSVASALFLAMYSDFEGYLNSICKAHREKNNYPLKLNDIYGNGIERAVTYLNKVVGINDIKSKIEWNELKHWNQIRNILIHNNGVIRVEDDSKSIQFLNLNINPKKNKVYLLIDDCERFHKLLIKFFKFCI